MKAVAVSSWQPSTWQGDRNDERRGDRGYDLGRDARELMTLLRAHGYRVIGGERHDSVGWGGWRNRNDLVLEALFPIDQMDSE